MKHPDTRSIQIDGLRPTFITVDEFVRRMGAEDKIDTITAEQFKRALCRAVRETDLPVRMSVPLSIEISASVEDAMQVKVTVLSKGNRWEKKYHSLPNQWDKLEG